MSWYDYILIPLGSTCVPIILFFVFKKYFGGIIDKVFKEEIEIFKQKLKLATEEVRFDYQRKIENYTLYIQRKHKKYCKFYELLLIAESKVNSLFGLGSSPTFKEFNQSDFIELLTRNNFTKGKIDEIILLLDSSRESAIKEIRKMLRLKELRDSEKSVFKVRDYYWLSKFYLTNEVDELAKESTEKLIKLQVKYEIMDELPYGSTDRMDFSNEANILKKDLEKLLPQLLELMKKELLLGNAD
ncbi:MAG: hypothetical protein M0P61_12640 [Ignavibacteriaceae bacterium]|jgi:hypothetical protein|nr:hypothetical protein [Ignavibacteriaceae bacterium]